MKGSEAADALEGLAKLVRARAECGAEELVTLLAMALGAAVTVPAVPSPRGGSGPRGGLTNAEHCKLKRLRRRGVQGEPTGSRPRSDQGRDRIDDPGRDLGHDRETTENDQETTQFGPPSALPLSDEDEKEKPSSSDHARPNSVATEKPTEVATKPARPTNLAEAMLLPIGQRARFVLENPHDALWIEPHKWREIVEAADAFAAATGEPRPRFLRFASDKAVQHLCELYAADFTPEEVLYVAREAPRKPWWNADGKRHGLTSLSSEVMRRTLAQRGNPEARSSQPRPPVPARPTRPMGPILEGPPPELASELGPRRPAAPARSREEQLAALRAEEALEAGGG